MIKKWMEHKWIDYVICLIIPHIALIIGFMFLARGETPEHNAFGLRLIRISLTIMVLGSMFYYIYFTPMFGMD